MKLPRHNSDQKTKTNFSGFRILVLSQNREAKVIMQSQVLLRSVQDLSTMDKGEVSKNLFGQIAWEEILRSGVFLEHKDVSLLATL